MSRTFSNNWLIEVNKGNIAGHSLVHKFGWRGNASTSQAHLWNNPVAGTDMIFPTVAETFDVVSADAADDAAGAGGRKVLIAGLDANFQEVSEEITMDGLTPVTTLQEFIRITRAYVTDCGTYGGTNAGIITISGTDSGNNYGFLETEEAQTQNTQYCVPAGKTAYMLKASITTEANKPASFSFHHRPDADVVLPRSQRLECSMSGTAYKPPLTSLFKLTIYFPLKLIFGSIVKCLAGLGWCKPITTYC